MGKKTNFTEEEIKLMKEMDAISAQAEANPEIRKTCLPDSLWYELQRDVNELKEEKKAKELEQRNLELIKLGLVYERKRRYKKYYVLAATLVLTLALGITSFGGAEKIFNIISGYASGRNQININSGEDIEIVTELNEELVYEEVEKEFGFYPIRLDYLPEGIVFKESIVGKEIQKIVMIYGKDDEVNISYSIFPNYQTSSYGIDVEDKILEEYTIEYDVATMDIKKYGVDGTNIERWSAEFVNGDVGYFLNVSGMEKYEFETILNNLYVQ